MLVKLATIEIIIIIILKHFLKSSSKKQENKINQVIYNHIIKD